MINKDCGLTDRQRLYVILHKECLWSKPVKMCYDECIYYDDEHWCEYMDSDTCYTDGCRLMNKRNPETCEFILQSKRRRKICQMK